MPSSTEYTSPNMTNEMELDNNVISPVGLHCVELFTDEVRISPRVHHINTHTESVFQCI